MEKYFYCYSRPLKDFLVMNGVKFIMHSVHNKTGKKFWVFSSSDRITELLENWRALKS